MNMQTDRRTDGRQGNNAGSISEFVTGEEGGSRPKAVQQCIALFSLTAESDADEGHAGAYLGERPRWKVNNSVMKI